MKREAEEKREELNRDGGASADKSILKSLDKEILMRNDLIAHQENLIETACHNCGQTKVPPLNQSGVFIDGTTWSKISRASELRFLVTQVFEKILSLKKDVDNKDASTIIHKAVNDALSKEKRKHDKEMMELKMNHSETVVNLMESANTTVEKKIKMNVKECMDVDDSLKKTVDDMIRGYVDGCHNVEKRLKDELQTVRDTQDGVRKIVERVGQGISVARKKINRNAVKWEEDRMDATEFFEEVGEDPFEEEEDSEWDSDSDKRRKKDDGTRDRRRNKKKTVADVDDDEYLFGIEVESEKRTKKDDGTNDGRRKNKKKTVVEVDDDVDADDDYLFGGQTSRETPQSDSESSKEHSNSSNTSLNNSFSEMKLMGENII